MYEQIPNELKAKARFCLWRYEQRDGRKTKVPYQLNGCRAKSNDIACFSSFADVCKIADNYDGIGMGVFNGYSAIDIDHCVENGKLSDLAQGIVDTMNSYTEISPSGTGVRIIFKVSNKAFDKTKYYINNRNIGLEVYVSGATSKFVTITGQAINNTDVNNCDAELLLVLDKYMKRSAVEHKYHNISCNSVLTDEQVLEKAMNSKNADKFIALWNGNIPDGKSSSEADMSLAMHLAFWCGGNIEQMDRLFRMSGLMRDKWDRVQSGTTYGNITLTKAVNTISVFYVKPYSALETNADLGNQLKEMDAYHNYPATDNGTSRLFADVFKSTLRYVPERKAWYYYDGSRWNEDIGGMYAMEKCKALMLELLRYSIDLQNSDYTKYCNKMQSRHNRLIILNDAQSVYPISMSDFDKDKYLFNCNNGTLDLSTNTFREHCADDMITKLAPVDYDTFAECNRFNKFVNEIMSGDSEKTEFLQKALGYAISGDTRYECIGRKSTRTELCLKSGCALKVRKTVQSKRTRTDFRSVALQIQ